MFPHPQRGSAPIYINVILLISINLHHRWVVPAKIIVRHKLLNYEPRKLLHIYKFDVTHDK
jgi:hypothetical protein